MMYQLSCGYLGHIHQCKDCALRWFQIAYCVEGHGEQEQQLHHENGDKNKNKKKIKSRLTNDLCSSSTIYIPRGLLSSSSSSSTTPLSESDYPVKNLSDLKICTDENEDLKGQPIPHDKEKEKLVINDHEENGQQQQQQQQKWKVKCTKCQRTGHSSDKCNVDLSRYCNSCQVYGHLTEKCRDYPRLEHHHHKGEQEEKTLLNKK